MWLEGIAPRSDVSQLKDLLFTVSRSIDSINIKKKHQKLELVLVRGNACSKSKKYSKYRIINNSIIICQRIKSELLNQIFQLQRKKLKFV